MALLHNGIDKGGSAISEGTHVTPRTKKKSSKVGAYLPRRTLKS